MVACESGNKASGNPISCTMSAAAARLSWVATVPGASVGSTSELVTSHIVADAHTATKLTLVVTHLVAAAIVIPTLAARLAD